MKKRILKGEELEEVLDLRAMTELGVPGEKGPVKRRAVGDAQRGHSRIAFPERYRPAHRQLDHPEGRRSGKDRCSSISETL